MSPAVASSTIPPRKALNRDSVDSTTLGTDQTIVNEANHAARTSTDGRNASSIKPTIIAQGLATQVSGNHSSRSGLGRNVDDGYIPDSSYENTSQSIGQAVTSPTNTTNQAAIARKPVTREALTSSTPITAYSDTIGTNGGLSSQTTNLNNQTPSRPTDRAIITQKATDQDLMSHPSRVDSLTSGRTGSTPSSAMATGVASSKKLHGITEGVPITDQTYRTGGTHKDAREMHKWPLGSITRDPEDTKYYLGKSHNVAEGPLSAVFASTYAEPDMYSSTVHVHRAETRIAKGISLPYSESLYFLK